MRIRNVKAKGMCFVKALWEHDTFHKPAAACCGDESRRNVFVQGAEGKRHFSTARWCLLRGLARINMFLFKALRDSDGFQKHVGACCGDSKAEGSSLFKALRKMALVTSTLVLVVGI